PSEEPRQDESCQGQRRDQDDERLHAVGLLLAHRVVLVDQRCSAVAEDRDDDGQADRCLGRRDRDDQEGDDGRIRPEPIDERAEGDDREVDAVEHELDRHEHADRIAPGQEAEGADCEQQPGQDQVGIERVRHNGSPSSRLARKTPPITAASSSTLTISKGRTYCWKSTLARASVAVRTRVPAAPQSVEPTASAMMMASTTAANAAGTACVRNTSRAGAAFVCVSMIAKRTSTEMAP